MEKILVHTKPRPSLYPVIIGEPVEEAARQAIQLGASKVAVVDCSNTSKVSARIAKELEGKLPCCQLSIADGESNKNASTVLDLVARMQSQGLDRESMVIAVGGGTVGDMAACAASIFKRGIRIIHVPTTLLAMADSSIGGKTGVNLNGKNLIGTFHQPSAVVIDLDTLDSLPDSEFVDGLAEIVKCACIKDAGLLSEIEDSVPNILSRKKGVLKNIIAKSIIIKADLVSADELEMHKVRNPKQSRMLLNFGHTIGHAVEAASKFQISHGKAVSIGMVAECAISQELGLCSSEECERLEEVITRLGLPLSASSVLQKDILSAIGSDKKTIGGKTRMALLLQIGEATIIPDVPLDAIKNGVKVIGA